MSMVLRITRYHEKHFEFSLFLQFDVAAFSEEGRISTTLDNGQVVLSEPSVLPVNCKYYFLNNFDMNELLFLTSLFKCCKTTNHLFFQLSRGEICVENFITLCEWRESG